jgi:hypothetical protein
MTIRQFTSDEAHVLDHLVDCFMTDGTLVTDAAAREKPLTVEAIRILGSLQAVQRYVWNKSEKIMTRPVEGYDEDGDIPNFDRQPRAPFGGSWDDVPDDAITRQYMRESGQERVHVPKTDPLGDGTADRLEFGMLTRRVRRKNERN